jgi:pilus assembly protein Flp/PilA
MLGVAMRAGYRPWRRDEAGAMAVEYGLILGLVSIVLIVVLRSLGLTLADLFGHIQQALDQIAAGMG